MRKLDEVINNFAECEKYPDCPLCEYGGHKCMAIQDALAYLKEYQHMKKALDYKAEQYEQKIEKINQQWHENEDRCQREIALYQEAVKNCEAKELMLTHALADLEDNPPLTWEELREMVGKPVWVQHFFHGKWVIVSGFRFLSDDGRNNPVMEVQGSSMTYAYSTFGTQWQAYRNEVEGRK